MLPITPKILIDLYNFINIDNAFDLALWCSFLVAFYCLLRKTNVAPKSLSNFNPLKELSRQKFMVLEDTVLVYSTFSKTNQFMNRDSVFPLIKHSNKALDPVFHLTKLFQFDIPLDKPAFCFIEGSKLNCIIYDVFPEKLKSWL